MAPITPGYRPVIGWALLCLALGVVAVVVAVARFADLPDPYPTHFGLGGRADRFSPRSWGAVLSPVVVGQLSGLVVTAMTLALPDRAARLRTPLAALGCAIGGGIALMSIQQYLAADGTPAAWGFWAFLVLVLATTVWLVVVSLRVARTELADSPDRDHWRLGGLVYVNAEDPDVFVSKAVGLGTTLNLGRPMGWIVLALVLAPAVLLVVLVGTLT